MRHMLVQSVPHSARCVGFSRKHDAAKWLW